MFFLLPEQRWKKQDCGLTIKQNESLFPDAPKPAICSYLSGYERLSGTSWTNGILFLPWENLFILYLFLGLIKVGELRPFPLAWILPHSANSNRKGPQSWITTKAGSSHEALMSWLPWQSERHRDTLSSSWLQDVGFEKTGKMPKCREMYSDSDNSIISSTTHTGPKGFIWELSKLSKRKRSSVAETWLNKYHWVRKNQVTFESAVEGGISSRKPENDRGSRRASAIPGQGPRGGGENIAMCSGAGGDLGPSWEIGWACSKQEEESEPARVSPKSTSGEMLGRLAQWAKLWPSKQQNK